VPDARVQTGIGFKIQILLSPGVVCSDEVGLWYKSPYGRSYRVEPAGTQDKAILKLFSRGLKWLLRSPAPKGASIRTSTNASVSASIGLFLLSQTFLPAISANRALAAKPAKSAPATINGTAVRQRPPEHLFPERRIYNFPGTNRVGTLRFSLVADYCFRYPDQKLPAVGKMTLTVPAGCAVSFEPMRRLFEHPDLFDKIPYQGIDVLFMRFYPVDENEEGLCDKALAHASHFRDLQAVDVSNSDASDKGLSNLKSLPHLRGIVAEGSYVKGSCLQDFQQLDELWQIDFSESSIDQANLVYIPKLRGLTNLGLRRDRISDAGMRELSKATRLKDLSLINNPGINDHNVAWLSTLKSLQSLDLQGTSVTIRGLRQLSYLNLHAIGIPMSLGNKAALAEIRGFFPHAKISVDRRIVEPDLKGMLAPLK